MKQLLRGMNQEVRLKKAQKCATHLLSLLTHLGLVNESDLLGAFAPMSDEVPYLEFISETWNRLCFSRPTGDGDEMEFGQCSPERLLKQQVFGTEIFVPAKDIAPVKAMSALLVPGLAFSEKGQRLGRGKGYYDRYISSGFDGVRIGLCFSDQVVESLPTESHDIPMHYLVNDQQWLKIDG